MSVLTIDTGTTPNDGTGDSLRAAFIKTNANFTALTDVVQFTVDGVGVINSDVDIVANTATLDTIEITDTTQSTSVSTGAVIIAGGVGIDKDVYIGGHINATTGNINVDAGNIIVDAGTLTLTPLAASNGVIWVNNTGVVTSTTGLGNVSQVLTSTGPNSAPIWTDPAASATTILVGAGESGSVATFYPVFVSAAGEVALNIDTDNPTGMSYQPSTGTLTAPFFAGHATSATTATTATTALSNTGTFYIGTTAIAGNRASASQSLADITDLTTTNSTLTASLWNTVLSTGSISIGGALTTGSVNIASTSSSTGATINILTGAVTSGTRTVNIGTNGASTSSTVINIGTNDSGTSNLINIGSAVNSTVTINGSLVVNGTTGTINTATLNVDDKNVVLGSVASITGLTANITSGLATVVTTSTTGMIAGQTITKTGGAGDFGVSPVILTVDSPTQFTVSVNHTVTGAVTFDVGGATDVTADGGGITLTGTTDKTIIWDNTNDNWTSNQSFNLSSGLTYKINNVPILSSTEVTSPAVVVNSISRSSALATTTTGGIISPVLAKTTYRSVEFTVQASRGALHKISKILVVHDGTTSNYVEYGITTVGTWTNEPAYTVTLGASNIDLNVTSGSVSTDYKVLAVATVF